MELTRLPFRAGLREYQTQAEELLDGHVEVVRLLLDAGEDPSRYNPKGNHGHSTPLHQAVLAGHDEVVRLLVTRGARLDIRDTVYEGTPLGWAVHVGRREIADYLRTQGASQEVNVAADARPHTS